jgi:hypothetical protein
MNTVTARSARAARVSAAVSGARRPTTPAPTSSSRPASSSVRLCRMTVNTLISPMRISSVAPIFQAVSAPSDTLNSGPLMATSDGLEMTPLTACSDASVG